MSEGDGKASRRNLLGGAVLGFGCIPDVARSLEAATMAHNVTVPPLPEAPQTVVGSTAQAVFPFQFPFWASPDIEVLIDGVVLSSGAYSVQGLFIQNGEAVEGGFGSGIVTLNTPVANCTVTIDRFVDPARETQFSRSAPLGMPALNADLNKQTARDQDLARRSLSKPRGDLAGRFLAFDASGNPVAASGTGADAGLRADLAAGDGPQLLGFRQPDMAAVSITAEEKLRQLPVTPEEFYLAGDGADWGPAFRRMLNAFPDRAGLIVHLRQPAYRIATGAIYLTRRTRIHGLDRYETTLDFSDNTEVVNAPYNCHVIAVHEDNIAGKPGAPTNAIALPAGWVGDYGEGAGLFNVRVKCNPAVVGGIGVFANVAMPSADVIVSYANLHCFVVAAAADNLQTRSGTTGPSGLGIGGNSNLGVYTNIRGEHAVNGDGIHCSGADANQNVFIKPDCVGNKGWGMNDNTLHGNQWYGLHTSANAYGSFRSRTASPNAAQFFGPYSEGDNGGDRPGESMFEINERSAVIGASGAKPEGKVPSLSPELAGLVSGVDLVVMDSPDSMARPDGSAGADFGQIGRGVLAMRTTDGKVLDMVRSGPTYTALRYGGVEQVLFANGDIAGAVDGSRPYLPNGIALDPNSAIDSGSAAPTTGSWTRGFFRYNRAPSKDASNMILLGWSCTVSGSPGTWEPCYVSAVSPAT